MLAGVSVTLLVLLTSKDDRTVVKLPSEYHFRCGECDHHWSTDKATVTRHFGGGQPTTLAPVDCPSCGGHRTAFMKAKCLWCGEHYVHSHLLRPTEGRPTKDICPHCGKDALTWRK